MVELLDDGSMRARVIIILRSHRAHIYTYGIGHMMCAQTMFGRAWHALSTVRSQAFIRRINHVSDGRSIYRHIGPLTHV